MGLTRVFNTFFFLLYVSISYSQNDYFDNFEPLKSKGELPVDFTKRTSNKVSDAIDDQISVNDDIHTRRTKENFLLRSNYMIDNLLMSGNVLFGDPVTKYVNKVANRVLKDEPVLKEKIRLYCIKSNITNAFATNQGMIFITTGLLAQLENEAQLAFIIGHEINHFKNKHVINSALENNKIITSSKRKKLSQDQTIIQLSSYSKSLELESDSIGFYFLKNAGYDLEEALSSFYVLQYSELPYDEITLKYDKYETTELVFPSKIKLDTLIAINFEVDEDDSKSSHPNLNLRRSKLENLLEINENTNNNVDFIISEDEFIKIRDLCRFESTRIDLKNLDYIKAFYHANYLANSKPKNTYLQKSIAKSLYGIAKFKASNNYYNFAKKYTKYEGAISAYYHFFEKAPKDLISALAIKEIHKTNKNKPDHHLDILLYDLVKDFVADHNDETFDFDIYFPLEIITNKIDSLETDIDSSAVQIVDIENESKYDKLKRIRENQKKKKTSTKKEKTDQNYSQFIYTNYTYRDEIKLLFEAAKVEIEEEIAEKKRDDEKYDHLNSLEKKRALKKDRKEKLDSWKRHNEIGAEKVVFVDPFYYNVDERKGIKLENSEDKKFDFYTQITEIGELTKLETEILSPKLCKEEDADKINHLSICNDWIEELADIEDIDDDLDFIPSQSEYMKAISKTYGTDNFAFSGVIDYKKKKKFTSRTFLSAVIPYGWPLFIGWLVKPQHEVYYYTYIFNANTGKLKVDKVYTMKRKAMEANINSFMYDNFLTIKTAKQ